MARRTHDIGIGFKRVFPFFWKPCATCDQEFRFEFGWQTVDLQSKRRLNEFVCSSCAATAHEARTKCIEWRRAALRFMRPKHRPETKAEE